MAPQVGLEPTTLRLTAECSAIELLRNMAVVVQFLLYNHLLESGSDLLSRAVSSQVPSAQRGLTSVFGMGTGGSLLPLPPEILRAARSRFRSLSALRFRASPALTTAQLKLTSERLHSISRFFLD